MDQQRALAEGKKHEQERRVDEAVRAYLAGGSLSDAVRVLVEVRRFDDAGELTLRPKPVIEVATVGVAVLNEELVCPQRDPFVRDSGRFDSLGGLRRNWPPRCALLYQPRACQFGLWLRLAYSGHQDPFRVLNETWPMKNRDGASKTEATIGHERSRD